MDKKSRELVMGKLFLKNKDYKMAEKSFSEYLKANPEDYQALKMLAQVQEHLNDTTKAFDLYQRCYLAQPDRKGVLLDICRLLLIRDSSLDHVDQKKWLKLAAQSFPTNPIVTNLREIMPNSQDSYPGKVTTEDLILEKLTSLEDRFRNIEDRIKGIEEKLSELTLRPSVMVSNLAPTPTSNHNSVTPKTEPAPKPSPVFMPAFTPSKLEISNEQSAPVVKPVTPKPTATPAITPVVTPVMTPPKPVSSTAPSILAAPLFKAISAETPEKPAVSLFKPITSVVPVTPVDKPVAPSFKFNSSDANGKPVITPFSNATSLFSNLNLNPKPDPPAQTDSPFNFTGVNLFAESLKKNSLPTEGTWTSPKVLTEKTEKEQETGAGKEDYDADDNDSEAVNNEELPIESFCEMKPIEIKSGEEDEDILFEFRCKLFRFRDKEYKERGLGNIKVLKHKETGKGRLIMRREQINLVCLNCWSCTKIQRVRDTQVRFAGLDASDGEAVSTIFLAKFGTQEKTDEFENLLKELFTEDECEDQ